MPDIGNYTETTTLVLGEAGKYFALLLLTVLAMRLWQRWKKSSGSNRVNNLVLAVVVTLAAVTTAWFSMRQSLGKLYSHYGMNAFRADRVPQAARLFQMSSDYWKTPDVLGQKGVCLLLSGHPEQGLQLIGQAKTLRRGQGAPFEDFYEGLYFFSQGERSNSVPLLEAASSDETYRWSVVKLLAVMELDATNTPEAERLMTPFLQAEVTESDQAYIVASLKLAEGKQAEAQAILNRFPVQELSPSWKLRFEKLQAGAGH